MAINLFTAITTVMILACVNVSDGAKRSLQIPDITKLHISSKVQFRYAATTIESHVNNYNARASEVTFRVTLPQPAFISRFSMLIDNVTYPGHVHEKEAATKQYEKAKDKGQSAGIIKQKPRDTNVFVVSVNVAAKGDVDFTLVYEELLTRKFGQYEQVINVDPGQIVSDLLVSVTIDESRPLTTVFAPPIKSGNEVAVVDKGAKNHLAKIERISESKAVITFAPTKSDQKEMGASGMSGQFSVKYDVDHVSEGGEIQVVDGYFVHFFAPDNLPHLNKHVYFVLDVSGSMSGRKIEQMREAMLLILDDLKEGDIFTLMKFSTNPEVWQHAGKETHGVTPNKIEAAKRFIKTLKPTGGTNIYESLKKALYDMDSNEVSNSIESNPQAFYRANVIVFLTDGQPTEGSITDTGRLVSTISDQNAGKSVVLYSLGFGNDVDFEFLQQLSIANGGFARKIYESSDATLQLVDFYKEISSPLLANVDFIYLDGQIQSDSLTKTSFNIFYEGTEIIIAGRLLDSLSPPYLISSTINGTKAEGELNWFCGTDIERPEPEPQPSTEPSSYLERLWAYLTIQQRLEKKKAIKATSVSEEVASEATKAVDAEVLQMALKYEFVTPLTAMVVTKPELDTLGGRDLNGTAAVDVIDADSNEASMDYIYDASMHYMQNSQRPSSKFNALSTQFSSADYDMDYDDYAYPMGGHTNAGFLISKGKALSAFFVFLHFYVSFL